MDHDALKGFIREALLEAPTGPPGRRYPGTWRGNRQRRRIPDSGRQSRRMVALMTTYRDAMLQFPWMQTSLPPGAEPDGSNLDVAYVGLGIPMKDGIADLVPSFVTVRTPSGDWWSRSGNGNSWTTANDYILDKVKDL